VDFKTGARHIDEDIQQAVEFSYLKLKGEVWSKRMNLCELSELKYCTIQAKFQTATIK